MISNTDLFIGAVLQRDFYIRWTLPSRSLVNWYLKPSPRANAQYGKTLLRPKNAL
jgi:hypothetical protein